MEPILTEILSEIKSIHGRLDSIDSRLDSIDSRLDNVESRLDNVESRLANVESRLDNVESRLANVESRLDNVESQLGKVESRLDKVESRLGSIESQQEENTTIIKALLHANETLNAKYDQLLIAITQIEGRLEKMDKSLNRRINEMNKTIDLLAGDVSFLVRKSADHDDKIRELFKTRSNHNISAK